MATEDWGNLNLYVGSGDDIDKYVHTTLSEYNKVWCLHSEYQNLKDVGGAKK